MFGPSKEQPKKHTGKFFIGAAIGAAIGAVTALLTAPKSGRETRSELKDKATELSHDALRKLRRVEGELNKRISEARSYASKLEGDAKKQAEQLLDQAETLKSQALKLINEIKRDAKKRVDESFLAKAQEVSDQLTELKDRVRSTPKPKAKTGKK